MMHQISCYHLVPMTYVLLPYNGALDEKLCKLKLKYWRPTSPIKIKTENNYSRRQ
jgi:hypothetical protein